MKIYKKVFETATMPIKKEDSKAISFPGIQKELELKIQNMWESKGLGSFVNKSEGSNWNVSQYFGNTLRATAMALEGMSPREIFSIYNIHKRGNSKVDQEHKLLDFSKEDDPENPIYHKVIASTMDKNSPKFRPFEFYIGRLSIREKSDKILVAKVGSQDSLIRNIVTLYKHTEHSSYITSKQFMLLSSTNDNVNTENHYEGYFSEFTKEGIVTLSSIDTVSGGKNQKGRGTFFTFEFVQVDDKKFKKKEKNISTQVEKALNSNVAKGLKRKIIKEYGNEYEHESEYQKLNLKKTIKKDLFDKFNDALSNIEKRHLFGNKIYINIFSILNDEWRIKNFIEHIVEQTFDDKDLPIVDSKKYYYLVSKKFYDYRLKDEYIPSAQEDETGGYSYAYDDNPIYYRNWKKVKDIILESFELLSDKLLEIKILKDSEEILNYENSNAIELAYEVSNMGLSKAIFYLMRHFSDEELFQKDKRVASRNNAGFSIGNDKTPLAIFILGKVGRYRYTDVMRENNPLTFVTDLFYSFSKDGYDYNQSSMFLRSLLDEVYPKDLDMIKFISENSEIFLFPKIDFVTENIDILEEQDFSSRDLLEMFSRILKNSKEISLKAIENKHKKDILEDLYRIARDHSVQIGFNMSVLRALNNF